MTDNDSRIGGDGRSYRIREEYWWYHHRSLPRGGAVVSTTESGRWYVPSTRIGRILTALYLVAAVAVLLPLFGVAFNRPVMLGPFPQAITWSYLWFGVINVLLVAAYWYLFRPWAESATEYIDSPEADTRRTDSTESGDATETPIAEAEPDRGGDD